MSDRVQSHDRQQVVLGIGVKATSVSEPSFFDVASWRQPLAWSLTLLLQVGVWAAPLPRAAIEMRVPVGRIEGTRVTLRQGWREQLKIGMTLNLVDAQNNVVGEVQLQAVDADAAYGLLVGPLKSGAGDAASLSAVAPFALTITGVEGNRVTFLLPRGNRKLQPGDRLTIVRGGEPIGTVTFQSYRPVSGIVSTLRPGEQLRVGDTCWAVPPQTGWPEFPAVGVAPVGVATSQSTLPAPVASGTAGGTAVRGTVDTSPPVASPPANATPKSAVEATPDRGNNTPLVPSAPSASDVSPSGRPSTDVFAVKDSTASSGSRADRVAASVTKRAAAAGRTLSRSGALGMIRMPSAAVTPDGEVRIAKFGQVRNFDLTRFGNSARYAANVGFLPHLELGVTVGNEFQNKDLAANAKLQIVTEKERRPAVAIGVAEIQKLAGNFRPSYYGVLTKNLAGDTVSVSAGLLHNQNVGRTRPFGGLEVGVARGLSAVVEYDTRDLNFGARASFLRDRVQVAAHRIDGGLAFQVGVRVPLGGRKQFAQGVTLPRYRASSELEAAKAIQARLIALGLENIAVRIGRVEATPSATTPIATGTDVMALAAGADVRGSQNLATHTARDIIEVHYENRSFAHSEMDALANVMATTAAFAPDRATHASIVIERVGLEVLHVSCPLAEYRRFMAGELDANTFAMQFLVDYSNGELNNSSATESSELVDTGRANSSYGHGDLFLRPGLLTEVATDDFTIGLGLELQPELDLPLSRGLRFNARGDIPIAGPLRRERVTYDRLALSYAVKPSRSLLGQAFVGRFPAGRDGLQTELLWRPNHSRLLGRASVGFLKNNNEFNNQQKTTYVGEARYYLPRLDLNAKVGGGRYLEGDQGFTLGLARRFGDSEIGFEVRDTDRGRAGVVTLGIPLGPDHVSSHPSTLRLRPPDFLDYNQRSLLTRPNFVGIANLTGNELAVGNEATRSLLDRDRLHPAYLLRSLEELREIRAFDLEPGMEASTNK